MTKVNRAVEVVTAMETPPRGGWKDVRDGLRLVLTTPPVLDTDGISVVCHVRLYQDDNDTEIPVDPDRVFTLPPLTHRGKKDPVAALWHVLWAGVLETPNPAGWRP